MDGRHVPLWERDSPCGRGILFVEELFSLWKSSMPVGERFCLWKSSIPVGERFCLRDGSIPLGETFPSGMALSPWKSLIPMEGLY